MKTYVVIPAHNEQGNIKETITEVKKYAKNIVVVDDGSSDRTYEIAKQTRVKVLKLLLNLGKGAAIRVGCDYAYNNNADTIILIDSDGQHKAKDIPRILKALQGKDIVFTYRDSKGKNMPFILKLGNFGLDMIIKILFNMRIRDTQCGYKAFRAKIYPKIRWSSNDYSVESEIIANSGKHKLKYIQIPIATIYKDRYKGTNVISGLMIGLRMVWWKFIGK